MLRKVNERISSVLNLTACKHSSKKLIPALSLLTVFFYYFWYSRNYSPTNSIRPYYCQIPITPVFPAYFSKWEPEKSYKNCGHIRKLVTLTRDGIIQLKTKSTCCVQEIARRDSDRFYEFKACKRVKDRGRVGNQEVLVVKCGNETNMDAHIPGKAGVQNKLHFWNKIPEEERPYSVLIIGIDTVSRSHAFRSLPLTLHSFTRLKFVDFQAYHSAAPSTLTNFMAMLMGLTRPEVRLSCAKDWASHFDSCPLIWANYSESNFITGFIEDGFQSFNWGGQSGFKKQPVDYYIHHLFLALKELRKKETKKSRSRDKYRTDCVSDKTVPEFMLDYTTKFLNKFDSSPFFFMNWWNDPFHEDIDYLANFDQHLMKLFDFIRRRPQILRKTLIIFTSDHGDRFSFYNSKSIESYIERGLPPLFIRLPDQLREKHPEIVEALRYNSKILTSPFDIHHTLLHLLTLNSRSNSSHFQPKLKDRSSLFVKLNPERDCKQLHIPPTYCLCNIEYDDNLSALQRKSMTSFDKGFINQTLAFALSELNFKVGSYKHKHLCSEWKSSAKKVNYIRGIRGNNTSKEVIIGFNANPWRADFEARITVEKGKDKDTFSLLGFSRNNRFGDQSWCIPTTTDEDKEMKELCACEKKKP